MDKRRGVRGFFGSLSGRVQIVVGAAILLVFLGLGFFVFSGLVKRLEERSFADLEESSEVVYKLTQMAVKSSIENYLLGVAEKSRAMFSFYYNMYEKGEISYDEAYRRASDMLLDPDYGKIGKSGYLVGLSGKGILELHPFTPGADVSHLDFMQTAMKMKNGYIEYMWANPGEDFEREKAAGMAYFEPYDLIVWASAYVNEFSDFVNSEKIQASLETVDLGIGSSSFIINTRGEIIVHSDKNLIGKVIIDNIDGNKRPYIREIVENALDQGEGNFSQIFYPGEKPEEKDPRAKIAVYKYFPEMDWIIVSSRSLKSISFFVEEMIGPSLIVILIALFLVDGLLFILLKKVLAPIEEMTRITEQVARGDLTERISVFRNDEIGDVAKQFNSLLDNFQEVLSEVKDNGAVLFDSTQDLSVSAQEISSTSNQQAAAVKEIVSTMEDSDKLTKSIASKISEVSNITKEVQKVISGGFDIITNSLRKMDEIKVSNEETIKGIKLLGDKIESIWEIVNIINGIADQTKIIAFNAELEASAAGEAGKNFQIVATEIRRLADNTVTSTNEIKNKINEIQHSSDNLIIASEEGTEKVASGWDLSNRIQKVFEDILSSSEISVSSAEQIAMSTKQQVGAFEQILQTLKQISEGIDSFVTSTRATTSATDTLQGMADRLNSILEKYKVNDL